MGPNITFDGFGFNNANDEYKERLATLSKTFRSEKDQQKFGQYVETAVNCHADLLAALELANELLDNSDVRHYIGHDLGEMSQLHKALNTAHAAIAKAKGGA